MTALAVAAAIGYNSVMIQNIVFDMGNVLVGYDADYIVSHFADDPDDRALLLSAIFRSPDWARLDANAITEDDMIALIKQRLPARLVKTGLRAYRDWHHYNVRLPEAERLVDELKRAGYPMYLLSNAASRFNAYWRDYAALTALDGWTVSYRVGAIKPKPAIYQALFDAYTLRPEECFFVDDLAENIEGGRRFGMDGFVFDRFQYDALRDALRQKGLRF